jgi:hypothetical protein
VLTLPDGSVVEVVTLNPGLTAKLVDAVAEV